MLQDERLVETTSPEAARAAAVAAIAVALGAVSFVRWLEIDLVEGVDLARLRVLATVIQLAIAATIAASIWRDRIRALRLLFIGSTWLLLPLPLLWAAQPWDCDLVPGWIGHDEPTPVTFIRTDLAASFDVALASLLGILASRRWESQRWFSLPLEIAPAVGTVVVHLWVVSLERPWSAFHPDVIPRVACTG